MKIYTRTGDNGETSLIGKRISKDAEILDVLGVLDELNASTGIVVSSMIQGKSNEKLFRDQIGKLTKLQNNIFSISSILAGAKISLKLPELILEMENQMDEMTKELKPLTNFILPGGSEIAANLHKCRTACREAERIFVRYTNLSESRPEGFRDMRKYLNRLSDWLFTMARYSNHKLGVDDVIWINDPDALKLI